MANEEQEGRMTTTRTTLLNADPEVVEKIGRAFARGAVWGVMRALLALSLAFISVTFGSIFIGAVFGWSPIDDTDRAFGASSGLSPLRDHMTGCEYLRTFSGAITPRLGPDGRQICRVSR